MEGNGMRRNGIAILCLLAAIILSNPFANAEQENETAKYKGSDDPLCIPMGSFKIAPPESVNQLRTSVDFPHSKHFSYNCTKCHHKWDGAGKIQTCTASGCHDQVTIPPKPLKNSVYTAEAIKYYKYAYHNQCRDCHSALKTQITEHTMSTRETKTDLPKSVPTGCIECHPKD